MTHPTMLDPRLAGLTRRFHTWPHLAPQSVAEHSWQVQRIVLAVWPDAPRHLLIHCMVHDAGERVAGDLPYPVKAENPALKAEVDRVERDAHLAMCVPWGFPPPQALAPEEKNLFKLAEYVEMWEWSLHELSLGNRHAELVADRCFQAAAGYLHDRKPLPPGCAERTITYMKRRSGGTSYDRIGEEEKL